MSADTNEREAGAGGRLFDSVKAMASTLIAIIQTRAELLSTELEEERIRLTSILVWGFVALFCASLGVIFSSLLLVLALWDNNRLLAVGIPAGLFLSVAALALRMAISKARAKPRLFSASIAELSKDREQLTPRP